MHETDVLYEGVKAYFREFYKDIFPKGDKQYEVHFKDNIELNTAGELLSIVRKNAKISKDSKILDIGCGFGTFVLVCRMEGYKAYGIDSGNYEIEFAKKRAKKSMPQTGEEIYKISNAENLPFADNCFDIVTLWNILEHVTDYRAVLKEADRVLKKGGHIFVISPNYLSIRGEPHYHVLWFPMMPKKIAAYYLKLRGRNPEFLLNNVSYITNIGLYKALNYMKYEISDFNSRMKKIADYTDIGFLREVSALLIFFNPFKKGIFISGRKGI